jgi:pyrimidine oxygenase
VDIGVFLPIGNNGWLISNTSPQYKPEWDFEVEVVKKAESYGFDFGLSMIKLHGFGGDSEFWDYNLESFTMMAGLAAVTDRIQLYASSAILTIPPAIAARMTSTIDAISHGRFGMNIVTGWQEVEYSQMGLWPGDVWFAQRYRYAAEYVQIMKDLWTTGTSDLKGEFFTMDNCVLQPQPSREIPIVAASQSPAGLAFSAQYADYNFTMGVGFNTPTAHLAGNQNLAAAAAAAGRDVKAYVLFMIIAAETDEAAHAKWQHYKDGVDYKAIAHMTGQALADAGNDASSTAHTIALPDGAVNMNMGTLVGSYESVARMLDEAGAVEGTGGIMLVFDDFIAGMDEFGQRIQPLMASRAQAKVEV